MHNLNRAMRSVSFFILISLLAATVGCKKDDDSLSSDVVYQLDEFRADPSGAGKLKQKTEEQYVAVLYANLFQKAISVSELAQITDAIYSVGDKQLAYEMVVSNFLNRPGVLIPDDQEMRSRVDSFLTETYERFFVRDISEAERLYLHQYLDQNPEVTVEMVYAAFALSNEYQFY